MSATDRTVRPSTSGAIEWMSATEVAASVRRRELSPVDVARVMIERIEQVDRATRAFVYHDPDEVLADARRAERAVTSGDHLGPLHGVPYTVKDLQDVAGVPTTMGVPFMADNVAPHSDVGTRRLEHAGGLFLGKTNTPEFGWRGICNNHLHGPTYNPWNLDRTPGGSSGGAAAAVAAGMGPLGDGSDGAGSIRIPASFCGVVGYKPSFGRIPFHPPMYGQSIIHRGPLARTVEDVALMARVMAGPDLSDPHSSPRAPTDLSVDADLDTADLCLGWSPDLGGLFEVEPVVRDRCESAVRALESELGARVVPSAPAWDDPTEVMWTMWRSFYGQLAHGVPVDEVRGMLDDELIEMVIGGASVTVAELGRANAARLLMWERTVEWFGHHDALVVPTLPCTAFAADREHPVKVDGAPLRDRVLGWLMTYPFNLVPACPVVSVPCGFDDDGLPIGLSIVGRPGHDGAVLALAHRFEQVRPWREHVPASALRS